VGSAGSELEVDGSGDVVVEVVVDEGVTVDEVGGGVAVDGGEVVADAVNGAGDVVVVVDVGLVWPGMRTVPAQPKFENSASLVMAVPSAK
jgi:hypothetical protein